MTAVAALQVGCGGDEQLSSAAGGAPSTMTPGSGGSAGGPAGGGGLNGAGAAAGSAGSSGLPGAGAGGTGMSPPPEQPDFLAERGIVMPFVTYEAEDMATNGLVLTPTRTFTAEASEASGRSAVRLLSTGHYVEFENRYPSNSIVVRYSIPDEGPNHWVTLSVYVNGESRGKLDLTSRYSWSYGGDDVFNQPEQKNSGVGSPHHFFDEAHALLGDVPVGAKIMLKKDGGDSAVYMIDLVEMEQVAPPLPQPEGFVSLAECGAVPDDGADDSAAIQSCVDKAQGEGRGLYIPPGAFQSFSQTISVSGLTIRGAGMWHSSINGFHAQFECWGSGNCKFHDFAAFGDTTLRDDASAETFFRGAGSGGVVENVWVEHLKLAVWTDKGSDGLTIKNSRFRNLHADAVNLYNGTQNSVVEQTHIRNTGDDALAAWSHTWESPGPSKNNVFRKNYVQVPWRANCFGIYGGEDNLIEDCVCADVVQYPGVLFARQFDSHAFSGMTRLERTTLIRTGGSGYNHTHGALKFHADQGPVQNITVTDVEIVEPTYSGVHVQGFDFIDSVWLNDVTITNPGNASFFLNGGSKGALDAVGVVVTGGASAVIDESEGAFNLIKGAGSTGW